MAERSRKHPWWRTQGLLVAGGWHPLPARIRSGFRQDDEEEFYAWEYTEEHILRLKELGITALISQFDRGLGPTDQAPEQERARLQAELCHKHGLRHGCYLANTVYYESMLKDHPECEDWVIHTHDGRHSYYGGEQTWRWVVCFCSPGWQERMKREIKRAIEFVETDWLHLDNLEVWPEPDSCHCPHCQEAFKEYLRERYPDERAQRRRFGFAGLDNFRAPNFHLRFTRPWDLNRITNPLMRDWIDFRCQSVTDYLRELVTYARALKPDIVIDTNAQSIRGSNQALIHGVRQDHQVPLVDVVWDENPDYRPDDGRAVPRVARTMRGMNYLRRAGRPILTSFSTEEELAWNLTMGGSPGINTSWGYAEPRKSPLNEPKPGVAELLAHYRRRLKLYTLQKPAARAAVWHNYQSFAYDSFSTHLSAFVMEHLLWERRVPFSIVTDSFISKKGLRDFDLLIAPNVQFVSDEQLRTIADFVHAGGAALLTEGTAAIDGEDRVRSQWALSDLLKGASASDQEAAAYAVYGKGRIAYLPKIDYVHPPRSLPGGNYNVHYQGCDTRYWRKPYNAAEILGAIAWLYPQYQPVKVYGLPALCLDVLTLADGATVVPMMRVGTISPVSIRFAVRSRNEPRRGRLYVPEKQRPISLKWQRRGALWETRLPEMRRHAVVTWEK